MRGRTLVLRWLAVLTLATPVSAAAQQNGAAADLARLIAAPGVSGFEADARDVVRSLLPAWARPKIDEIGNLVMTVGQGSPHVLVAAPLDEDGYFVSDITSAGYLRLHRVTTGVAHRLFDQFHYGQPIVVRTARGALVPGVIATASTHLQRGRDQANTVKGLDDLWIDIGAASRAAAERLGVHLLDSIRLRERWQALAAGRVAGAAAQARGSALTLANLVRQFDRTPSVTGTLTIAWTAQSVFGERGLARLAHAIAPDRVVLVSRTPVGKDTGAAGAIGRLGGGPIVAEGDAKTAAAANAKGIPVQALPGLRVPNAFPRAKVQLVALPVLFAQSTVETIDLADLASMTGLLHALADLPGASRPGATTSPAGTEPPSRSDATSAVEAQVIRLLRPLAETYGVSGNETEVREAVAARLPKWAKPEVDAHGNLTISFGRGATELVFVAHLDEIGYELTTIEDDGTATVRKRGGFMDLLLEAHPVLVHTSRGRVPAIVAPRANYLRATEGTPRAEDLRVYFGTSSRADTEALGVARGDTATVRKQFQPLGDGRVTARSLDDRAGVAALLAALQRIDPAKVPNRITFAWVVGEETGLVGSGFLAERLHPSVVFAVDTFVSSDSPIDPQRIARIPLGSGAVVRAIDNSSITPADTIAHVLAIARAHQLPIAVGTTGGGNDGSRFSPYGSIVVPLSWPGRYSHSPVEVLDSHDLGALVSLIAAIVQEW